MKLEIKKEFLDGTNNILDIIVLLLSDKYETTRDDVFVDRRMTFNKSLQFPQDRIERLQKIYNKYYEDRDEKKRFFLENTNIHEIVVNSNYEPLSYHFIMDFFKQILGGDYIATHHKAGNYVSKNRNSMFLLRKYFIDFLNLITNLDDLRQDFIQRLDEIDNKNININFEHEKEKAFMDYLIYESFPANGKLKKEPKFKKFDFSFLDGSIFFIGRKKEKLYIRNKLLYVTDLYRTMNMANLTDNSLFL